MHRNTRGLIAFFGTAVAVVVVAAWAGYKSYMAPLPKTEDTFQVCLADTPERCPQQPTVFLNCTEIKDIPSWAKTNVAANTLRHTHPKEAVVRAAIQ